MQLADFHRIPFGWGFRNILEQSLWPWFQYYSASLRRLKSAERLRPLRAETHARTNCCVATFCSQLDAQILDIEPPLWPSLPHQVFKQSMMDPSKHVEQRPAKRAKLLSDDEDSDSEDGGVALSKIKKKHQAPAKSALEVNQDYAKRFEHNKKREELHRRETILDEAIGLM